MVIKHELDDTLPSPVHASQQQMKSRSIRDSPQQTKAATSNSFEPVKRPNANAWLYDTSREPIKRLAQGAANSPSSSSTTPRNARQPGCRYSTRDVFFMAVSGRT